MEIFLDILGVLAIVGIGSLVVILVAEFLISLFDKHNGVFFNRAKKEKKVVEYEEPTDTNTTNVTNNTSYIPYTYDEPQTTIENVDKGEGASVDEKKAAQEEKLLASKSEMDDLIDDSEDEDEGDDPEFVALMDSIRTEAMTKKAEPVVEKTEVVEEVKEEPKPVVEEKVEPYEPKVIVVNREVPRDDSAEVKKLRELRTSILTKKKASQDLEKVNNEELERRMKELNELKAFKIQSRQNIIKLKTESLEEIQKQQDENEELRREVAKLKKQSSSKPYFTREYYEDKKAKIEADITEAEKELKANKREYLPLKRVQRAYDRDSEKLRKKEISVAKQKISLYGVGSTKAIDAEKKQRLDDEVKLLNELKDSVFSCEQVLKTNKDRLTSLEKTNKVLTKQLDKLNADYTSVKEALAWYDKNEGNKNSSTESDNK